MNKTVNINLAGIFFHIDEDAYLKLQRYLEAIKRSFTDSQGRSEIIADIEARIAELFNERVQNDKQVIGIKQVDEVIAIMGQPEDYIVDDEIFEDEPSTTYTKKTTKSKKLFRDADNSYVGGVSSGLAHYFGIDTIWIRLAWIILIFGLGTGILLYILLWILVPEAKTTAEKITMTGEPVNITNIEKKIKDGFENVTDTVGNAAKNVTESVGAVAKNVGNSVSNAAKNADFKKQTSNIKSSSQTFFDALSNVIMFMVKLIAKFVGILLIFIGAVALIALIIGLLSVGAVDIIHIPGLDLVDIANTGNTPIWLVSLLSFFAIGIPFFFLFYLGLKILITNLKSIGNVAKFTLLGLWLLSVIALVVVGIRQASEHAFEESYVEKAELPITATDTLMVKMTGSDSFHTSYYRNNGFKIRHNEDGEKIIYSTDIDIRVKSTTDDVAKIVIEKRADGSDFEIALNRAKKINYNYTFNNNTLFLNDYLTTDTRNKFSDQKVDIYLYLPEGMAVYFNNSTQQFLSYYKNNNSLVSRESTNHYLQINADDVTCLDCPKEDFEVDIDTPELKIDNNSLEINTDENNVKIDENGVKAKSESVRVNISSNGIEIESEN
ncbi:phage-shock protein [Tamlana nanhaiensis]|uniref:Phage-shock protein n=1 Tax=Neotamlana nanhaiensis TaxID=1382798 RepID=A0A0D7VWH7_9FLAO|nr:PspC domain-containing protein [Tamlana nanhaiensis]KJD31159.1 phage-shock protein [Tamlana nanhaiensis]